MGIARQLFSGFDEGAHDYDLGDSKAINFDSLQLASALLEDNARDGRRLSGWQEAAVARVDEHFHHLSSDFHSAAGISVAHGRALAGTVVDQQSVPSQPILMAYEAPENIFTPSGLQKYKEIEDLVRYDEGWGDFCFRKPDQPVDLSSNCSRPTTAINIFYASEWNRSAVENAEAALSTPEQITAFNNAGFCVLFNETLSIDARVRCQMLKDSDPAGWADVVVAATALTIVTSTWDGQASTVANGNTQEGVDEILKFCALLKKLPLFSWKVDYFFGKSFSDDNLKSRFTRSLFLFGIPLEGYADDADREEEQADKINTYFMDNLYDKLFAKSQEAGEVKFLFLMVGTIFDVIISILIKDALLAIFAVIAVLLFLWLQTGSWFIASMGMVEILLSLPTAYFFYRAVFQIRFFGALNAMVLFLVLAIGADDIFVFMDAYKQSAHAGPVVLTNLSTRMTWVYKRAGLAMLITSATTCAAFLCTCLSPLASQISFGIFAALVIFCDYVLVMTFFCTTVVIYHNAVEVRNTCGFESNRTCCCALVCCFPVPEAERSTATSAQKGAKAENTETLVGLCTSFKFDEALSLMFGTKIANFVLDTRARVCIAVVCVALFIPMAVLASQIAEQTVADQFLPSSHPFQQIINVYGNEFPSSGSSENTEIFVSWGIGEVNRDGVNQLIAPNVIGTGNFDQNFVFNAGVQRHILQACTELMATGSDLKYPEMVRIDTETGGNKVNCWVYDLNKYVNQGSDEVVANPAAAKAMGYLQDNYTWPVPTADLPAVMTEFMSSPATGAELTILDKYTWQLGWDKIRQEVRFVTINMESWGINANQRYPHAIAMAEYNKFERYVSDQNKRGAGANLPIDCFQSDMSPGETGVWNRMVNQKIYQKSAVQGAVVGVCIAFVVIACATRSLIVASVATLSITGTLVCVLGCMVAQGWQLGTIEAILISITAGFSVDYVVHLAHAYVQKIDCSRSERVAEAFDEMGASVFSGMATSFMAAFVLLFCQVQFFFKFGVFLAITITFSWLWANFFFMGCMATFGPETTSARLSTAGRASLQMSELPEGTDVERVSSHEVV
jgi:predicted RND superfamily exporter protein